MIDTCRVCLLGCLVIPFYQHFDIFREVCAMSKVNPKTVMRPMIQKFCYSSKNILMIMKYFYYTLFFFQTNGKWFSVTIQQEDCFLVRVHWARMKIIQLQIFIQFWANLKMWHHLTGITWSCVTQSLKVGKSLGAGIKSYTQENKLRHLFSYVKLFGGGLKKWKIQTCRIKMKIC